MLLSRTNQIQRSLEAKEQTEEKIKCKTRDGPFLQTSNGVLRKRAWCRGQSLSRRDFFSRGLSSVGFTLCRWQFRLPLNLPTQGPICKLIISLAQLSRSWIAIFTALYHSLNKFFALNSLLGWRLIHRFKFNFLQVKTLLKKNKKSNCGSNPVAK